MDEPTSVAELLQRAELVQYAEAFEEQGYDSMQQLRDITEADLADLVRDVNMKKGHVKRLHAALGKSEGAPGNASSASAEPAAAARAGAPPAADTFGIASAVKPEQVVAVELVELDCAIQTDDD
jgi:hypothetical protein